MLVRDADSIRLAMLGMVEGNGHPFSWSAIINGEYDDSLMAQCGYPTISEYLGAQPRSALGIPGARVTHVWCDDANDAQRVARAAHIPRVVADPKEVIGEVDAVIVATDIGHEHIERVTPFIDAGLPVFIDKPLTDRADHLATFVDWVRGGAALMSTSCMRYAEEYRSLHNRMAGIGELRLITVTMAKSWERYGIHAIEAAYPFLRPGGYEAVRHSGNDMRNIIHIVHADQADCVLAVVNDLYGAFGCVTLYGTEGQDRAVFTDTFNAFKAQLEAFIHYLRTGVCPVPFGETIEQMKILIAGLRSREQGGALIHLSTM